MLEKVFVGDRRYWSWLLTLAVLAALGAGTYLWQQFTGTEASGLSRDVAWGFFIANYTFLVGVAASAVMVVLPYYLHNQKQFGPIAALGEFLAVAAVAAAGLFIIVDIGQPTRLFNILLYPTPNSPFFWNTLILPGYMLLNLVIAWFTLEAERSGLKPPGWVKPLVFLSIPWAVSIHTVTSFVYSGIVARPYWNEAILTPRFLASAFASGPALLVLLALAVRRFTSFDPGREATQKIGMIVTYAMIVNMFLYLAELFSALFGAVPEHVDHFRYLYFGLDGYTAMVPWAWTATILGFGVAVALLFPRVRSGERSLAVACAVVFIATWIDKGMCLVVGGFIPTPLGTVTEYVPSAAESMVAVGVYAISGLLLTLLYRITVAAKQEVAA